MMNKRLATNPFYHYQVLWKSENFKKWQAEQTSKFKQYRKLWQQCPNTRTPANFPLSINIEITDRCNASTYCIMCPKHFLKVKNAFMNFSDIKNILKEAKEIGTYAVNLNGAGESLLHPDFIEIVSYAKKLGFIDIMVHTNATMLTEQMSKGLVNSGLARLIISVDSHNPVVYEQMRPSFSFKKVLKNIEDFISIRNAFGKREPILRLTVVVMNKNVDTIHKTVSFWKSKGIDYITINDCMYFDNFKVFEFDKENINKAAEEESLVYICAPLYQQLSVTIDKKVISCSTIYAKNNKVLGSWPQQSLREIWNGKTLRRLREAHESGRFMDVAPCSYCDLPQIELLKRMRNSKKVMLS